MWFGMDPVFGVAFCKLLIYSVVISRKWRCAGEYSFRRFRYAETATSISAGAELQGDQIVPISLVGGF